MYLRGKAIHVSRREGKRLLKASGFLAYVTTQVTDRTLRRPKTQPSESHTYIIEVSS
jgi:hypothetical protein